MGFFCLFFCFCFVFLLTSPHQCLSEKKWGKWRPHFELVHTVRGKNKWDSLEEHLVLCWGVFYLMETSFVLLTSQLYISWQNTEKKKKRNLCFNCSGFFLLIKQWSLSVIKGLKNNIFSFWILPLGDSMVYLKEWGFKMRTEFSLNQLYVSVLFHHFSGLQTSCLLNNAYMTVSVKRKFNWIFVLPQMVVNFLIRKFYSWLSCDFIF